MNRSSLYSLRTRLVLAFLAVALLSLGALAFLSNRSISTALSANAGDQLKSVAQSQALTIGDQLAQEIATVKLLSVNQNTALYLRIRNRLYPSDAAAIREQIRKVEVEWQAANAANDDNAPQVLVHTISPVGADLRQYRSAFPNNVEVIVTDRYGALYATAARTLNYYYADDAWWQATSNGGKGAIYISQPAYDPSSKTYAVYASAPVFDPDTRDWIGAVRATFRVESLKGVVASTRLGKTGQTWLRLPDGQLLTAAGLQAPADPQAMQRFEAATQDYIELDYGGVPYLMSQAPVASSTTDPAVAEIIARANWHVIASQYRSESLAPVQGQTQSILALALVIAIVVAGVGFGMARLLAEPIARLTTVAQQVAAGDLTAVAHISARDEIGALAQAFNSMTAQLRGLIVNLEEQVKARTAQLSASAEVGRAISSILDAPELLRSVVSLISERFGYYYVAVFMLDESGQYAVLQEATGEAGRVLRASGHRLDLNDNSMVAAAITADEPRMAMEVESEKLRFANPLLPDTRSEIALPLRLGGRVIGALDAQSTQPSAFDESIASVLQSMADQVAVSLGNASLYTQVQQQAKRQEGLARIAALAGSTSSVDELLGRLMLEAKQLFGARVAVALLKDDAQQALVGRHVTDDNMPNIAPAAWRIPMNAPGFERSIFARGGAYYSDQGLADPNLISAYTPYMENLAIQNFCGVALRARESLGELYVANRPGGFGHDDVALLKTIAGYAANAIQNAQLFEATQRLATRERLINAMTARVRAGSTLQDVLQVTAQEIAERMGAVRVTVRLKPNTAGPDGDDHDQ